MALRSGLAEPCARSVRLLCALLAIALLLTFSGCVVGPDYFGAPSVPLSSHYTTADPDSPATVHAAPKEPADGPPSLRQPSPEVLETPSPDGAAPPEDLAQWWRQFHDPILNELVDGAVAENLSLQEAAYRLTASRARVETVRPHLLPQFDMDAEYDYRKQSSSGSTIARDLTYDVWSWGSNFDWEIDVFGRLQHLVDAAEADAQADLELYRDTRVLILAELARNYVAVRSYQEQERILRENIGLRRRTLDIAEKRFAADYADELDVAQARYNLTASQAELPSLAESRRAATNRIGVLLGLPPGEVDRMLQPAKPIPRAPDSLFVGVPADLLRRRPDIRQAECEIAAQTARVGAAVGELYPRFSITGSFGLDARSFSRLFDDNSIAASIGPSMQWDFFNFGRLRANVRVQEAERCELTAKYRRTVLEAAEEVDTSLAAFVHEQQRRVYLRSTVDAARRSVDIADKQYDGGHQVDFQRILDSQRVLLNYERLSAVSDAKIADDAISVYRALGGGW